ncbi:spore coat protein U domain-containing protein [Lysobacter arenosi]|uniref:Spore coat protein U domain-containing protein n=1 Tax=Lysobacter arenosi TaxID=2795387 RepID=A0ABX7R7R5_9GAMM|nr:spore coat protein U domain-containing protein [Lysobacter arenosi]QSX74165.1 spore coat protein U domain-containing protein [Lysobacter arenosi]
MRAVCLLLLMLAMLLVPKLSLAQTCSSTSSGVYFGNVAAQVPATDATGTINISCTGTGSATAKVCVGIVPSGYLGGRVMFLGGNDLGGAWLEYEIYSNPGRTSVWNNSGNNMVAVDVPMVSGTGSATLTMYARMDPEQGPAAGLYRSGLTDDQIRVGIPRGTSCNSTLDRVSTSTFDVNVSVLGTCTFTADPLMNFGIVNGAVTTAINVTRALHVRCNNMMAYSIALSAGNVPGSSVSDRRMARSGAPPGAPTAKFQLYLDPTRLQVWGDGNGGAVYTDKGTGATQDIPVYGQVPPTQNLQSGTYTSVVTATVTY